MSDYSGFGDNGIVDEAYVRFLIQTCLEERESGKHKHEIEEGDRLAIEFRKMFTEISDKDLGTFIVILTRVLGLLSSQNMMDISKAMDTAIRSYSHAAAVIWKTVIDLKEL